MKVKEKTNYSSICIYVHCTCIHFQQIIPAMMQRNVSGNNVPCRFVLFFPPGVLRSKFFMGISFACFLKRILNKTNDLDYKI